MLRVHSVVREHCTCYKEEHLCRYALWVDSLKELMREALHVLRIHRSKRLQLMYLIQPM